MKRISAVLLAAVLLLWSVPALASDVCVLAIDQTAAVTTGASYLRVTCPLNGEAQVTLTVLDGSGICVYMRDYGICSGRFVSDDLYLPAGNVYQVSLNCGTVYSAQVARPAPRERITAVSAGYPVGGSTVTLFDPQGGSVGVPVVHSRYGTIGTATLTPSGNSVTVHVSLDTGADLISVSIRTAFTQSAAAGMTGRRWSGREYRADTPIPLEGSGCAALYIRVEAACSGVSGSFPDTPLAGQAELWTRLP